MHFKGSMHIIKGHLKKKKKSKIYVVYGCGRVAVLACYIVKLQLLTKISKHKVCSTVDLPILFA